ncbi:transposase, partial [Bacilli bacterium PM5-3]|nr:transposase [Bacilli bacterium PM5-3]
MSMTNKNNIKSDCFIMATLDELVPQDHLVRKLENCIDFTFIYPKVESLYSDLGRPSIDPVVLFKMMFINIIFGINSMRRTCKEVEVNMAYRWFLGLTVYEKIPNYSTWSQNYIRRYSESTVFEEIFDEIIRQAIKYDFIDMETVFGDSTHQKANANKNKSFNKEVEVITKSYEKDLLKEINEDRIMCNQKPVESLVKKEIIFDENTGEDVECSSKKNIKVSKSDPESGCFHKGEKEKCFAYSHQTFCDRNGFVISTTLVAGNIHDSTSFFEAYNVLNKKYRNKIKNISLDAGYKTPAICREIFNNNQVPYMPYTRPRTKKGYLKKHDFVYDEVYDCYICPNEKILTYYSTSKDGYRKYKSEAKDCKVCRNKKQCTKTKEKVITRHVWTEYVEEVEHIRHTNKWKEI